MYITSNSWEIKDYNAIILFFWPSKKVTEVYIIFKLNSPTSSKLKENSTEQHHKIQTLKIDTKNDDPRKIYPFFKHGELFILGPIYSSNFRGVCYLTAYISEHQLIPEPGGVLEKPNFSPEVVPRWVWIPKRLHFRTWIRGVDPSSMRGILWQMKVNSHGWWRGFASSTIFLPKSHDFDGEWYGKKGLSIHLQEAQIQSLSNLNDIEASWINIGSLQYMCSQK